MKADLKADAEAKGKKLCVMVRHEDFITDSYDRPHGLLSGKKESDCTTAFLCMAMISPLTLFCGLPLYGKANVMYSSLLPMMVSILYHDFRTDVYNATSAGKNLLMLSARKSLREGSEKSWPSS